MEAVCQFVFFVYCMFVDYHYATEITWVFVTTKIVYFLTISFPFYARKIDANIVFGKQKQEHECLLNFREDYI